MASRVAKDPGLHQFAQFTPDIFVLPNFLQYADYPRFLSYLIESRQMEAVLIGGSELGYGLVPLRAYHPKLPIVDYLTKRTRQGIAASHGCRLSFVRSSI